MAISAINEPASYFPIWNDYYFKYSSTISNAINFKYNIQYQQNIAGTWTTIDTFARFPDPDDNTTFNIRKYLSSKTTSDYFMSTYALSDGLYTNPLLNSFRLLIQEAYAYQFPWGNFNSSGVEISNGVSANATKYYGIYNLKLTYTYSGVTAAAPAFVVGSVVQLIDNQTSIPKVNSLDGIYTVLEVGTNYIVINAIYDSSITYYSGSLLWSDHRQIIDGTSTYTSGTFTNANSCGEGIANYYTSLPDIYNLRSGSVLMLPAKSFKTFRVKETAGSSTIYIVSASALSDNLIRYTIPSGYPTIQLQLLDASGTVLQTKTINVNDKCESRFQKTTVSFLDRNGSFIPFYFDLANVKTSNYTANTWKGLNQSNRGTAYQIESQVSEGYLLTTDWLTDIESQVFEELLSSNYIYMFFENSTTPQKIFISDKQFQFKKTGVDRIFNYQLNVTIVNEKFINQ